MNFIRVLLPYYGYFLIAVPLWKIDSASWPVKRLTGHLKVPGFFLGMHVQTHGETRTPPLKSATAVT